MSCPSLFQKWHPPRKTFFQKKSKPISFKFRSLSWDLFLSLPPIQKYLTKLLQARKNEPPNRIRKWVPKKESRALKSSFQKVVLKQTKQRRLLEFHRREKGGKTREKQWRNPNLLCQFLVFPPKSTTKRRLHVTLWAWSQTNLKIWSRQKMLYQTLKLCGWKVRKDEIGRDL